MIICTAPELPPAEPTAAEHNAPLDAQIAALELRQHRATREMLLETDTEILAKARARLAEFAAEIAALRAQRVVPE